MAIASRRADRMAEDLHHLHQSYALIAGFMERAEKDTAALSSNYKAS